ncbi:hypothetical protein KKH13_05000 [Patescibacteria group bacterium]|nr:hypothetical protein [Patescibacteria group bacterium]
MDKASQSVIIHLESGIDNHFIDEIYMNGKTASFVRFPIQVAKELGEKLDQLLVDCDLEWQYHSPKREIVDPSAS